MAATDDLNNKPISATSATATAASDTQTSQIMQTKLTLWHFYVYLDADLMYMQRQRTPSMHFGVRRLQRTDVLLPAVSTHAVNIENIRQI